MSYHTFLPKIRRFWRPAPNTLEHNIRLLYVEVFWAAIMGGVISFNAAFAVRLGASKTLIGLLSAVPPLIAALLSIPIARVLERRADRRPYILWGLFVYRAGFLIVALLPTLIPINTATWLVVWLVLLNIPLTIFAAGWIPMLADILPERRRAFVFSRRNIIRAAMVAAVTLIAGSWLSATIFPYNYQAMYAFSLVGAALSCIAIGYLKIPASEVVAPRREAHRHLNFASISWGVVRERVLVNRAFLNMTFNSLVFNFGVWMAWPLYILYFVNELNADDGWLGLNSAIGSLSVVFGFYIWERVIRHKDFHWALTRSMSLSFLYPFLLAIFPNLTLFLAVKVLNGLINSGKDLSHINVLLKLCPRERRASYLGFHNTVMNLGAFVAPLVAVTMADHIGIRAMLLVSAAVRLGGGLLFYVFKVDVPPEEDDV